MPRHKVKYRKEALADVNMTNLIDIVMVLLIVFILVSNFVQTGLNIQLPEVQYVETTGKQKIVIGVDVDGNITLNQERVTLEELSEKLQALKTQLPEEGVYVQADEQALVGQLAKVMSASKQAGFTEVNLPAKLFRQVQ